MNLFKRKKNELTAIENEIAVVEPAPVAYNGDNPIMVSVPEVKEYLVREFGRVRYLQGVIDELKEKLEDAEEVQIKYDAAMVALDEYSKRLTDADDRIFAAQKKFEEEKEKHAKTRDELNSYKIRLGDAALTKAQIKNEIVKEIKDEIISALKAHKGTLSKTSACEIVKNTRLPKEISSCSEVVVHEGEQTIIKP